MHLSWIIPAYNEEKRIEKTLREVDAYLKSCQLAGGYEIIVANSASRDRTAEIVKNLQLQIAGLRLLNLENKGKGWAVKQGMLGARGEIRLFSDADNSVSPEQADKFLPLVCAVPSTAGCFDVVIGSIEAPSAVIEEKAQWYRRMLGRLSKYVIRVISGLWEIRDSQRGFKFFSRQAAEIIFPRLTVLTWGFDIEVLLIAKRRHLKIKELPVHWVNPPDSKVGLGSYLSTFFELLQIKWNDRKGFYR